MSLFVRISQPPGNLFDLNILRICCKRKRYNPLLLQDGCENLNIEKIREIAKDSIYFTLGELANAYTLLNIKKFKPILDNVIYLGLSNTFNLVLDEKEFLK